MKTLILAFSIAFSLSKANVALAGDFEDAASAYNRKDYATALKLLMPLAESGNATAQYYVGILYFRHLDGS